MNFEALSLTVGIIEDLCAFNLIERDSSAYKEYESWLTTKQQKGSLNLSITMNWGTSLQVFEFNMLPNHLFIRAYDLIPNQKTVWFNFNSKTDDEINTFENCTSDALSFTLERLIMSYYESDCLSVNLN